MNLLICSDGTPSSDYAVQVASLIAGPSKAATSLLGISERPQDKESLRLALISETDLLRSVGVEPTLQMREGDPVAEIVAETQGKNFDLIVVGARRTTPSGFYLRSEKMYELMKALDAPVLAAIGSCDKLRSFIVCTGGKAYIEAAVMLTGKLAAALDASVTLLHVMAEPPAMYADLVAMEEDVDQLLGSSSELGRNLLHQKQELERLGVKTSVRLRHGLVVDEVFKEIAEGGHDLVVTGSSRVRGTLRHYIMGDVTRRILNHAELPVLVARSEITAGNRGGFFARWFGARD